MGSRKAEKESGADMKLSIIVPVYNMASDGKLEYCMDSLVGQELDDYEIIAVDDCSTDGSLAVLQDYARRFPDKVRAAHSLCRATSQYRTVPLCSARLRTALRRLRDFCRGRTVFPQ